MGLMRGDVMTEYLLRFLGLLDWQVVHIEPSAELGGFEKLRVELRAIGDSSPGSIDLKVEAVAQQKEKLVHLLTLALAACEEYDNLDTAVDNICAALKELGVS